MFPLPVACRHLRSDEMLRPPHPKAEAFRRAGRANTNMLSAGRPHVNLTLLPGRGFLKDGNLHVLDRPN
eukprot:6847575-Alexandrium_andersonii.AAC.1